MLLALTLLAACGGGSDASPSSPPENWARLRDFAFTPTTVNAPVSTETLQFRLDHWIDFQSNTYLPTFVVLGHLIPQGQTLLSPETTVGRLLTQNCGQQAYACGAPYTVLCNYAKGWLDAANRRVQCDSNNLAIEVPPGDYQWIASVCYTDNSGTRICSSKTVPITFQ